MHSFSIRMNSFVIKTHAQNDLSLICSKMLFEFGIRASKHFRRSKNEHVRRTSKTLKSIGSRNLRFSALSNINLLYREIHMSDVVTKKRNGTKKTTNETKNKIDGDKQKERTRQTKRTSENKQTKRDKQQRRTKQKKRN